MKPVRLLLFASLALALGGCATRPKTYQAPDAARVNAATRVLTTKVKQARDTAGEARTATKEAREMAARLIVISGDVKLKLEQLRLQVPEAYRGAIEQVQKDDEGREEAQAALLQKLDDAIAKNNLLETQLGDAERARANLQTEQTSYAGAAGDLAKDATDERNARIKDETTLHWYRMRFYGSWIALGLGVIACGVFAFLKFTGRLAIIGAKL